MLRQAYPLQDGTVTESLDDKQPPRVQVTDAEEGAQIARRDPLVTDRTYHDATLTCNRRITASDWYQDVRHFEFELGESVQ